MASMTLFLLFAVLFAKQVTAEINDSNIISLNTSLSPKSNSPSWASPSGLFSFGFYQQGNGFAVGIWLNGEPQNTIVWTANRDHPFVSSDSIVKLGKDGLSLKTETGIEILINVSENADSASMLDSGNFVLYGENSDVIWQSFDHPTDTLLGNQTLHAEQELVSALSESDHTSGHFAFYFRPIAAGNYVIATPARYARGNDFYWITDISNLGISQLTLNLTGFVCLGNGVKTIRVLANSSNYIGKNTNLVYRATLDVDGIFRLYAHIFQKNSVAVQTLWQNLPNQCQVLGFCGINSYCSNNDGDKATCKCFPGFIPINGNKSMFLHCEQKSKYDHCTSEDPGMLYHVAHLPNFQWPPNVAPYWVIPLNISACESSCQEDCDCDAVLHVDDTCKKYNLPLMFGRINKTSTATAIIKLPSTSPPNRKKPAILKLVDIDNKKNLILTLVLTLSSISFVCIVLAVFIFFIYKHQVYSYKKIAASASLGFAEDCSLRIFSFDELVNSTRNFTEEIGRGSSGVVYKGTIRGSNKKIAVKKLDVVVDEQEREFQAEITAIARTHHRNLVQLIGYCIDGSKKLLVYEYMSNGSLADFLFKAEMRLSWKQRVKIALDVARGVLYLHEECEVSIVHCNIKPQNILMDETWTGKISDFGFARLSMPEHSKTTIQIETTSGYVAPERQKDALASVKVDIFSYGVVLLEIICCRRNIDVKVSSEEEIMLSSWVYNCFVRGELNKLVVDDYEDVEWKTMERMVKVGLWCVQEDLSLRPSMKNVILMLEGLKDIPIPPSPNPLV